MKLFLEGSKYRSQTLKNTFGNDVYGTIVKGNPGKDTQVLDCVGYCLSADKKEHVFILPKVFRAGNKAFGTIELREDRAIELNEEVNTLLKNDGWDVSVVSDLPLYLYLAIDKFRRENYDKTEITFETENTDVMSSRKNPDERLLLDIILTLRDFYRDNENLFVLIYKQAHSGFNKVNWTKTVRIKMPAVTEQGVFYPLVINHKKEINYDEELLIILFNTLRYINAKYGFKFHVDQPYNLMSDSEFKRKFESGIIKRRLEAIRNAYYNEKLVQLWELLHIFADQSHKIKSAKAGDEFLLVRKFNIVFEAMIDRILGDSNLPPKLWKQADGKIVDHLFRGASVLGGDKEVYYIGDSKYYKDEAHPVDGALFKQYTYAKNIIQQEIDWYHKGESDIIYRDELTEGYNITPNFFISGFIDKTLGYTDAHLSLEPYSFKINWQFPNRIFDRDTLFLRQYNINFLFVIYAYVAKAQSVRNSFKEKAKGLFKEHFIKYINKHYDFYLLKARNASNDEELRNILRGKYFWRLNGKVFSPYGKKDPNHGLLVLGLENPAREEESLVDLKNYRLASHNHKLSEENTDLLLSLEDDFIIKEYHLGTEPYVYYEGTINGVETSRTMSYLKDVESNLLKYKTESVLFGCYRSSQQLEWITRTKQYNVRYTEHRKGTVYGHCQQIFTAIYLFLYNYNDKTAPAQCYVLDSRHSIKTGAQLQSEGYELSETSHPEDLYFVYRLLSSVEGSMVVEDILAQHPEANSGAPLYLHFAETQAIPHEWNLFSPEAE